MARLIPALLMLLIAVPIALSDCADDFRTLERFYEASKQKDYDTYISLMDTEYIYDHLADEESYRIYVESAWALYDTESYFLKLRKCNELPEGSIIFFDVDALLSYEGKKSRIERIYTAVFEKGRLQFVVDYETFAFSQNLIYTAQYYSEIKDIIEDDARVLKQIASYEQEFERKRSMSWIFWVLIIAGIGVGAYSQAPKLFKNKKINSEKIDSHMNKIRNATSKSLSSTVPVLQKLYKKTILFCKKYYIVIHNNAIKYFNLSKDFAIKQYNGLKKRYTK